MNYLLFIKYNQKTTIMSFHNDYYSNPYKVFAYNVLPTKPGFCSLKRTDYFEKCWLIRQWAYTRHALPIPNVLKEQFASEMADCWYHYHAEDNSIYYSGREKFLNDVDQVQSAQREFEKELWKEFKREQTANRRTRLQGIPIAEDRSITSGNSDKKEFIHWVAKRVRVYTN